MRTLKNYSIWMAGEITKTYLLATGFIDISTPLDSEFDMIAIPKTNYNRIISVVIKPSRYSKSEITRVYKRIRQKYVHKKEAVIIFYINYMDKTGYFEVIQEKLNSEIITLTKNNLISAINNIIDQYKEQLC